MSKIADLLGRPVDHMVKPHFSSCSVEIFGGANTVPAWFINRGGSVLYIPFEAVEEVMSSFSNTCMVYSLETSRVSLVKTMSKTPWAKYVLEDGPWLIRTVPLILNVWSPNTDLKKAEVKKAPVWIKLHHVPIVAYSEIGLSLITTQLALIEVSAENELLDSLVIAIPIDKDNGHTLATIDVEYEWNPPRCATCKIFDHHSDICPKLVKDQPVVNDADEGFVEVKKKKHKNKNKQHKVAGLRLTKPQPQLLYRRVDRGETSQKVHTDKAPIVTQAPEFIVKNSFGPLDENEGDGFHDESLKQDDVLNVSDNDVDEEFQVDRNGNVSSNRDFNVSLYLKESTACGSNVDISMRDFLDCVEDIKMLDVQSTGLRVVKKLKNLKKPLRKLLYDNGNVHANVNKLRTNLDAIQTALDADPFNVALLHDAFVTHYEMFLGHEGETSNFNYANLFNVRLNDQDAQDMVREISNQEVKDAIFSIGDDKSPGPDGFTAAFFKEAWNIIANDVYLAVREFFRNGTLLKEINHTIIALLPKVKSPSRVNDYRPISCCNVLFKCISKIIANRIKHSLKTIISPNQSAFIPGRSITDNILLTQELMHNYHLERGTPRCAFKVDIQKAYDTVDWDFLRIILLGFGFHQKMVSWIMECVTSTSYSICVNGSLHGYFKGKRGLRQGDPLSRFMYCSKMELVNLCFADDLFLFAYGDVGSASIIMEALDEFKNASGLVPSLPKIPFSSSRLMIRDCNELVDKFQIPYLLGSVSFSSSVLLIYESSMRQFLWCHGSSGKGKSKVAWEIACLPKHEGGLGIRRLECFNSALMASHIWKLLTLKESLWDTLSLWSDYMEELSSACAQISPRNIVRSGLSLQSKVQDVIHHGLWIHGNVRISVSQVWDDIRHRESKVMSIGMVWFPSCIPRHAINLWLIIRRKLKTQDLVPMWDVSDSLGMVCSLCESVPDSHDHLFFECPFAKGIWDRVKDCAGLAHYTPNVYVIIQSLMPIMKRRTTNSVVAKLVVAAATYYVWQERNWRLFKKGKRSPDQIVECIKSSVRLKLLSCKLKKSKNGERLEPAFEDLPNSGFK
ncbi:hypothetical protein Tco_0819153 [Tanacetum coccineum]|uniref:Reverse transcriptase domain-containing protein n=1 Tax=Tanacetum coccineum TaxID=301880 RepID=A0ABQ5AAC4_9ASTR